MVEAIGFAIIFHYWYFVLLPTVLEYQQSHPTATIMRFWQRDATRAFALFGLLPYRWPPFSSSWLGTALVAVGRASRAPPNQSLHWTRVRSFVS